MPDDKTIKAFRHYTRLLELLDESASSDDLYGLRIDLQTLMDYLGVDVHDATARKDTQRLLKRLRLPIVHDDGRWTSRSALLTMRWTEVLTGGGTVSGTVYLRFSASVVDSYQAWQDLRNTLDGGLYRSLVNPASRKLLLVLHERWDENGKGFVDLNDLRDILPLSPRLGLAEARDLFEAAFGESTEKSILKRNPLKQRSVPPVP